MNLRSFFLGTLFISSNFLSFSQSITQVGSDIDGESAGDFFGSSVSISSDGKTVAVGAVFNGGNGANSGHVRVYNNINGTWTQIGSDIDGEASGDKSGQSVSLSSDGKIIAIGAMENNGNGSRSGHVRVYQNNNGTWVQVGSDIDGETAGDQSGTSVSLSSDGSIVAIGAWTNNDNGTSSGHVRIYQNINGTWTQIGSDIDGEAAFDYSGWTTSLSTDGKTIAVGAPTNGGNGTNSGHVRVYNNINGTWTQIGSDIDGEASGDRSGQSVSLSSDGNTVAIGAYLNGNSAQGHVRVYQNVNGVWTQIGSDIDGVNAMDRLGNSVSLSSDGKTLAIGAYLNDGNGTDAGHVKVLRNVNGSWRQIDSTIDGEASGDQFGYSVLLSSNGRTLVIGGRGNDGNGAEAGHVRVYSLCNTFSTDTIISCNSYTWTDSITYTTSNTTAKDTFVNVAGCDSVVTLNLTILESTFDTLNLIACDSVISTTNKVYKSTGTYYDTLLNAVGCDSIITTFLVVGDTTLPTVLTKNATLYLDQTGNATILTSDINNGSSDNCGISSMSLSNSNYYCSNVGANTVYLIVSDVYGNIDSASAVITVHDTFKPIVYTQTVTISLDSNGTGIIAVSDVDSGTIDNCGIDTIKLSKSSFDCFEVGTNSVFLVVTDVNGNMDSASATIIVQDTIKPTVLTQLLTVSLDSNGLGSIVVSDIDSGTFDNCGIDTIKLSKSSFDCSELGANTVYLIATDVNGNIDSASVTVMVQDTIKPSAVSQPLTVNIDSTGIAILNPMDADNGSFDNCNIASVSLSKSVFLCSDVGIDTIYLIVSDNDGNLDSASLVVTVQDTIKPTINTKAAIVSLDSSGNGILQRKQIGNGTSDNCSIANRVLSRTTYDCSDIGTNTVYFIATDVNGNVDSASAIVTVIDTINPTVLTQTLTVHLDASGNGSITATEVDNGSTDNCSIDTMILSKSTFDCSEIGDNLVFLIVTDVNGNVDSASATITVQDTLKPVVLTQPVTVSLDANGSGGIKIADVDNGSTDNCTMASISLSKSSFDCSELGANTVYLIVTDVNGNVDSASATITVQDLIKPTVVNSPDDIALGYCDANYSYPLPTGDDNCSVTVTQVAGLPPGSTFPVGVTVNTFEISDPSGNTVSTSFKIDVRDRYMPFTITDLSLCKNTNKIDLTKGYDNIIFNGSGVESNSKFFNSNSLDPGSYSITAEFLDSMGCTTTEQFEIVIRSIPVMPSIKRIASDQIITTIKYDNYQWYRNGEELTGENKQLLRVNELGIYSVIVGNNENCSQISEGYGFGLPVNDENVTNQGVVKVFPNPTRDFVFIQINDNEDSHLLIVADALGNQLISQETNTNVVKIDISTLAPGNYFLNIFSGTTNETIVIVKK